MSGSNRVFILIILLGVVAVSCVIGFFSYLGSGTPLNEWLAAFGMNTSSELLGAGATYLIFEVVVRRREQQQDKRVRLEEKRERALRYIAGQNNELAKQYLNELRDDRPLFNLKPLQGVDLTGAALAGADLSGFDLSEVLLVGADLQGATLTNATLTNADLSRANLTGANLRGANLHGAALHDTNLTRTTLDGADLTDASLRGALLADAHFDIPPKLESAVLPDSGLFGVITWSPNVELNVYTKTQAPGD